MNDALKEKEILTVMRTAREAVKKIEDAEKFRSDYEAVDSRGEATEAYLAAAVKWNVVGAIRAVASLSRARKARREEKLDENLMFSRFANYLLEKYPPRSVFWKRNDSGTSFREEIMPCGSSHGQIVIWTWNEIVDHAEVVRELKDFIEGQKAIMEAMGRAK